MSRFITIVVLYALAIGASWLLCGALVHREESLICLWIVYFDAFVAPVILLYLLIALLKYQSERYSIIAATILLTVLEAANPDSGARFMGYRALRLAEKWWDERSLAHAPDREFYSIDDTTLVAGGGPSFRNRAKWKYHPSFKMLPGVTTFSAVGLEYHQMPFDQVMSFKTPMRMDLLGSSNEIDRVVLYGSANERGDYRERVRLLLLFRHDLLVSSCISQIWNIANGPWQKGPLDDCPPDTAFGSEEWRRVTDAYFCSRGATYIRHHGLFMGNQCELIPRTSPNPR